MSIESGSMISDLLARARTGDQQALERLFAVCRNYLAVVARTQVESWVRAKFDPSDLVQQTLLEAYRGFNTFHGETGAEWLGWLRHILTHNAVDCVRHYGGTNKRQARREVSLQNGSPGSSSGNAREPMDGNKSPSEQLLIHERELLLADALARLAPDHHEVIVLRNLQGLPFEQVAERMGRSRPAAQMLWMRAIQKLHEMLKEEESE